MPDGLRSLASADVSLDGGPVSTFYPYGHPAQMTPMLPGAKHLQSLVALAAEVIAASQRLARGKETSLARAFSPWMLAMSAFYSNQLEGIHADPLDLVPSAIGAGSRSRQPDNATRQILAHVRAEDRLALDLPHLFANGWFDANVVRAIHRHLYAGLNEDDCRLASEGGEVTEITPGQYRQTGVRVGTHIPPDPATIPAFMLAWESSWRHCRHGELALIALAAAHHRLVWIHPFVDGNGRTARLHWSLALAALRLTHGLWSPVRGLARQHDRYFALLAGADAPRAGDLDGRGNLSERCLVAWIEFALQVCREEIDFIAEMLDHGRLDERLRAFLCVSRQRYPNLVPEAVTPILALTTQGLMLREQFMAMTTLPVQCAEGLLADALSLGIAGSDVPDGLLDFRLSPAVFSGLFPALWPELDAAVAASVSAACRPEGH